ncbi:MAG TPA: A/G-specific adenine glycosylase [Catalimonadaceae bacterium]|nr:A/G-specific adenine glycosylase [Catalimonadaceae bacterium]
MIDFSRLLISWFRQNGRDLPWRQTSDPYRIWLSEVIMQQTRVAQGMKYYERFCERFPTIKNLAEASEEEVLEIWQGLGYYSRARNLYAAAKWVLEERDGIFPDSYAEILRMKGVGEYTAAAVSSFAFHEDQVVVDGNVLRVFSRLFGIEGDIRLPKIRKQIYELVRNHLPSGDSWYYNQSIMELGALVCTPTQPNCQICPVAIFCDARKSNRQGVIPYKSRAKERRRRFLNYFLFQVENEYLFFRRGEKDIWEGLFEPYLIEANRVFPKEESSSNVSSIVSVQEFSMYSFPVEKHILSHQELLVSVSLIRMSSKPMIPNGRWVSESDLEALPKPVIFSKIMGLKKGSTLPLTF